MTRIPTIACNSVASQGCGPSPDERSSVEQPRRRFNSVGPLWVTGHLLAQRGIPGPALEEV